MNKHLQAIAALLRQEFGDNSVVVSAHGINVHDGTRWIDGVIWPEGNDKVGIFHTYDAGEMVDQYGWPSTRAGGITTATIDCRHPDGVSDAAAFTINRIHEDGVPEL